MFSILATDELLSKVPVRSLGVALAHNYRGDVGAWRIAGAGATITVFELRKETNTLGLCG